MTWVSFDHGSLPQNRCSHTKISQFRVRESWRRLTPRLRRRKRVARNLQQRSASIGGCFSLWLKVDERNSVEEFPSLQFDQFRLTVFRSLPPQESLAPPPRSPCGSG